MVLGTRGHKSKIDYLITNRKIHTSRMLDMKTLSSVNTTTNHIMVVAKIKSHIQPNERFTSKTVERMNGKPVLYNNKAPLSTETMAENR